MAAETLQARFRRLLTLVPFVIQHPGVAVGEVCQRFGIPRSQLVADLNLLLVCGLPGYGPGDLIEAFVDGNRVWIRLADYFSQPLRLTPAEGLLLYAGAQALKAAGVGDSALDRALQRLEAALGPDALSRVSVQLDADRELATIREALTGHRRLHLTYHAASRDATTERDVDPWALLMSTGRWYLVGWCHAANDERIFRVDRMRTVTLLDDPADIPADADLSKYEALYVQGAHDLPVTLDLDPQAVRWVVGSYPITSQEPLDDGWVRVHLSAGSTAWLEKLLLRLGPQVRVIDPQELAEGTRRLACRLAERYRQPPALAADRAQQAGSRTPDHP